MSFELPQNIKNTQQNCLNNLTEKFVSLLKDKDIEKLSKEFQISYALLLTSRKETECDDCVPPTFDFKEYYNNLIEQHGFTIEGLHLYIHSLFVLSIGERRYKTIEIFENTEHAIKIDSNYVPIAYTEINRMIPDFTDSFFSPEDFVVINGVPLHHLLPEWHQLAKDVKDNKLPENELVYFNDRKPYKEIMKVSDYRIRLGYLEKMIEENGEDYVPELPDYDLASEQVKKVYWFLKPNVLRVHKLYSS